MFGIVLWAWNRIQSGLRGHGRVGVLIFYYTRLAVFALRRGQSRQEFLHHLMLYVIRDSALVFP